MLAINQLKKDYGTEISAVILCCRVFFETAGINELGRFIEDEVINWEKFREISGLQSIRPTVYNVICKTNVPPVVKRQIQAELLAIIKINWRHAVECERLVILLKQHNIHTIAYKGVAYSQQFFGDLASRESSDIDLFIDQTDLNNAIKLLKADGYLPEFDDVYRHIKEKFFILRKDYSLNKFSNGKRDFHLELHWAVVQENWLMGMRADNMTQKNTGDIPMIRSVIKTFETTTHFTAILIHHALTDIFKRLKNVLDLSQAFRHGDIKNNEQMLIQYFEQMHIKSAYEMSNILSEQLFGVSLSLGHAHSGNSKFFLDKLGHSDLKWILLKKNTVSYIKARLLLKDRVIMKDRLKYRWLLLKSLASLNVHDYKPLKLPEKLNFLYYVIKPFRVMIKLYNRSRKSKNDSQYG